MISWPSAAMTLPINKPHHSGKLDAPEMSQNRGCMFASTGLLVTFRMRKSVCAERFKRAK
jgi:hypothetical protein